MTASSDGSSGAGGQAVKPPAGYRTVHDGMPLPPYYAAEMLRRLVGRTVWVADKGGRVRNGELQDVPWTKEDQRTENRPATFADEKPLFLREIVLIAVYDPKLLES